MMLIAGFFLLMGLIYILSVFNIVDEIYEVLRVWAISYFILCTAWIVYKDSTGILVFTGFCLLFFAFFFDGFEELSFFAEHGMVDSIEDFLSDYIVLSGIICICLGFLKNINFKETRIDILSRTMLQDPLTGVYNRRALSELYSGMETCGALTFCYIDLDGFKKINDDYGHEAGDSILVDFCRIVTGQKRSEDNFFRVGGDEFLLVIATGDSSIVESVMERIRVSVGNGIKSHKIDFSYGSVIAEGKISLEKILDQADYNMYQHKKHKQE